MVNLEVRLNIYSDLEFPTYVWVNDEETREHDGCYWVSVSVNDDDFEPFKDFLNANEEEVLSYEIV